MNWLSRKSKSTLVDSASTLLSFGSTSEGKEHWRAKDLPPLPSVQIHRPKTYWESAQRLIDQSEKEDFVAWASGYLSHKLTLEYRLETLRLHSPEGDDFVLQQTFDRDYFVTALKSGLDTQPGEYRYAGIAHPEKWEALLLILKALPVPYRSYEDDARLVKHRLVGDSDWGYAEEPRSDPVATGAMLGDYYKRPGGTITTIDHVGRLWEWTKGAKGFSDEYPGGKSESGLYAWQLCPGQPEKPKITRAMGRTPLGSAALNVRLRHWGMTGFLTADGAEEALSERIFSSVESDTRNPPPRLPTSIEYPTDRGFYADPNGDNEESYDNYGEGPSSRA